MSVLPNIAHRQRRQGDRSARRRIRSGFRRDDHGDEQLRLFLLQPSYIICICLHSRHGRLRPSYARCRASFITFYRLAVHMMPRLWLVVLACLLAGCASDACAQLSLSTAGSPPVVPVHTRLALVMHSGDCRSDSCGVYQESGATLTRYYWHSSDTAVATVDSRGRVYGVRPGNAVISARRGASRATLSVRVVPRVATFRIEPHLDSLCFGDSASFRAVASDVHGRVVVTAPIHELLVSAPTGSSRVNADGGVTVYAVNGPTIILISRLVHLADTVRIRVMPADRDCPAARPAAAIRHPYAFSLNARTASGAVFAVLAWSPSSWPPSPPSRTGR